MLFILSACPETRRRVDRAHAFVGHQSRVLNGQGKSACLRAERVEDGLPGSQRPVPSSGTAHFRNRRSALVAPHFIAVYTLGWIS